MTKIITDSKKIDNVLTRGVGEIIDRAHLKKKLLSGQKLRIKLGIDPTGPRLHIGRSIPLLKLRDFQELGHQVVLIIGDFTGLVGDTSDKTSERPMLDKKTVETNMKTYIDQLKPILATEKIEVRYNSEWLSKLKFMEIAEMANLFSVHDFTARENIKLRLDAGKRVVLREVLYPLMQGYDSVAVKADVELGGTDQRFNLLAGRAIQPLYNQEPQNIIMNPVVDGLDGKKMSTSQGNIVAMQDDPAEQYGKIMSVRDELILPYFEYLTRVPVKNISGYKRQLLSGTNPRDLKMILARTIVEIYHSQAEAKKAELSFVNQFQKGEIPKDIPEVAIPKLLISKSKSKGPIGEDIPSLLLNLKLVTSKSEARRLIEQKAVHIDGALITDWQANVCLYEGMIIQVGKRKIIKIKK